MSEESINGWKPPVIQEPHAMTGRIATQQDIDLMQHQLGALYIFSGALKRAMLDLEASMSRFKQEPPP